MDLLNSSNIPSYPLTPLANALAVGEAVAKAGGARANVSKAQIAQVLGCSDASGAYLQRLSSARSWGIIDGNRGAFRLTREGERYLLPVASDDRRRALLHFVNSPPVFAEIIKKFDGSTVPAPANLANLLQKDFKISEAWKGRVVNFFTKAAAMAEIIDARGYLRYRAALEGMGSSTSELPTDSGESFAPPSEERQAPSTSSGVSAPAGGGESGVLTLGGVTVRVQTSGRLSEQLWNLLNSYVQALKPNQTRE